MPAIAMVILQMVQVGMQITPEVVAAIQAIIQMVNAPSGTVPTAAQWQVLDTGLNNLLTQQQAILAQNQTPAPTTA